MLETYEIKNKILNKSGNCDQTRLMINKRHGNKASSKYVGGFAPISLPIIGIENPVVRSRSRIGALVKPDTLPNLVLPFYRPPGRSLLLLETILFPRRSFQIPVFQTPNVRPQSAVGRRKMRRLVRVQLVQHHRKQGEIVVKLRMLRPGIRFPQAKGRRKMMNFRQVDSDGQR